MELEKFLKMFLKGSAMITIADKYDVIYYSGLLKNLPLRFVCGEVDRIEGLGSEDDIIIIVRNNRKERRI